MTLRASFLSMLSRSDRALVCRCVYIPPLLAWHAARLYSRGQPSQLSACTVVVQLFRVLSIYGAARDSTVLGWQALALTQAVARSSVALFILIYLGVLRSMDNT